LQEYANHIKADLHTHTYYSDGILSPSELVAKARESGLNFLSVTDHDNVDGLEEALDKGKELGIEVIPGVELSTELNDHEVHVLGYFMDFKNSELLEHLIKFRGERYKRAERIVKKLNSLNVGLEMSDVLQKVRGNASIGRPHIAFALIERNFVGNYYEAFIKYLGDNKPAYEKKPNISTKDAIGLISRAGGISFVAHPGKTIRDNVLIEIMELGIDGFEVVHPSHSPDDVRYFRDFASQYFMLESGGSDFHGGRFNDDTLMGSFWISERKVREMKHRLFFKEN
jgi:hypothetical protein